MVQVVALWLHGRVTFRSAGHLAGSAASYRRGHHDFNGPRRRGNAGEGLQPTLEVRCLPTESDQGRMGIAR